MTSFFYVVIAAITFVAFLHAWSKKKYDVSRTIVINRSKTDVYSFCRQLKNQTKWNNWLLKSEKTHLKFNGLDGKDGAVVYWKDKGKHRVIGEGAQKIIKVKPGRVLETRVLLIRPIKAVALTYLAVKEIQPERTKIIFGIRGYLTFPYSVISIFYSMENRLSKDVEQSLRNLKHHLEN